MDTPFPEDWYVPANMMYKAAYKLLEKLSSGRYLVDKHGMDKYLLSMEECIEDVAISLNTPEKNSQIGIEK